MKKIIITAIFLVLSVSAYAEDSILGKWADKSNPAFHQYEFKKGNEFVYAYRWDYNGKTNTRVSKGVWEIGAWTITKIGGIESSCNLTIYAGTEECCFDYKFIAKNLIMTIIYKNDSFGSMCKNRVLVRKK